MAFPNVPSQLSFIAAYLGQLRDPHPSYKTPESRNLINIHKDVSLKTIWVISNWLCSLNPKAESYLWRTNWRLWRCVHNEKDKINLRGKKTIACYSLVLISLFLHYTQTQTGNALSSCFTMIIDAKNIQRLFLHSAVWIWAIIISAFLNCYDSHE